MYYAKIIEIETQKNNTYHASNVEIRSSTRVELQIFLTGLQPEKQLVNLLKSPIGVYVSRMHTHHDMIEVTLDIAREDSDFTLHIVLSTISDAIVGSIVRRTGVTMH